MKGILRVIHTLLKKVINEDIEVEISTKRTETTVEPSLIIKGNLSQDDLQSLYRSQLWHITTGIENNQFKITLVPLFKDDVPSDEELPFYQEVSNDLL